MKPIYVTFRKDWDDQDTASPIVQELVRRKLLADGDEDAETFESAGGEARQLVSSCTYRNGYLRIRWAFTENDETAEVERVGFVPSNDDDLDGFDVPPE